MGHDLRTVQTSQIFLYESDTEACLFAVTGRPAVTFSLLVMTDLNNSIF